jgi:predicted dehydrogenase
MSTRRAFLQASAAAGLAVVGVSANYAKDANDTIQVGLIGCGGRCGALVQSLLKIPKVHVAAVCDVWDVNLAKAQKWGDGKQGATKDYKAVLDLKDIDAVLIATPDHWHVPITMDACAAGKDVYVEKPLTHDLSEGKAVIEAQNKHKRIVQVGTQQRSMPHIQKGYEIVKSGRIGKVHKVHLTWNRNGDRVRKGPQGVDPKSVDWKAFVGNARQQPFDEYRFRNWRWFFDFGGGLFTDLMVHWIDVAHWFLGLDHPETAQSIGQHFMSKDVWETPDSVQTLLTYPKDADGTQVQAYFEGNFSSAYRGAMITFMGTDGTLYIDRGRYELHPERDRTGRDKFKYEELVLGSGRRGQDFYDRPDGELVHLTNWVESMRSRKAPTAPAEAGVSGASAAHLANQALRAGQIATWKS